MCECATDSDFTTSGEQTTYLNNLLLYLFAFLMVFIIYLFICQCDLLLFMISVLTKILFYSTVQNERVP